MRLVSYNVNGLRSALNKGLADWIRESDIDVICIQETKSLPDQVDASVFTDMGFEAYWHSAEKKGYSGVLTLARLDAIEIDVGMQHDLYDSEGRVLTTVFKDWALVNVYIPSGSSGEDRHDFKMKFLEDFYPWVMALKKKYPNLVVVGDYNIVHLDIDIHNPTRTDNPSGFRPEERSWLRHWFADGGFTDAYRHLYPDRQDAYSWWSYRAGSRQKNKGWRIDYINCANSLAHKIRNVQMLKDVQHSDHCAVILDADF